MLIEAEGTWAGKHKFTAEKVKCDPSALSKEIKESTFLEYEPLELASGSRLLRADGEQQAAPQSVTSKWFQPNAVASSASAPFAGRELEYSGVRQPDGTIAVSRLELGSAAPAGAYKNPGGIEIIQTKDEKTKIDILEVKKGNKVLGRIKLLQVPEVREYVQKLGESLLPPAASLTTRELRFRFFVVEDAQINAAALPDGTVLVNTGLLGAVENEAQLAFVLSHEIAHTLQAHHWREANETRGARIGLAVLAIGGSAFVGDVALFLGQLGIEAVVNGHSRRYENQADRLGLQNIVSKGYDPREAPKLSVLFIEHYGDRSTSKIWSNHESSLMRGSFLVNQIRRQYPYQKFDATKTDSAAFRAMKEAMGPVKVI
jgi:Peptidase family M48